MKELLKRAAIAGLSTVLVAGFSFASVGNDHTGFDSENKASIESEYEAEVDIDNDADLDNDIDGHLETGNNEAKYNTGDGEVETGDASAEVSVTNMANDNTVTFAGGCLGGCPLEDMSVVNSTTGAESENDAWIEFESKLELDVDNDADVDNDIDLCAHTGGNEANYNTGDGSVSTGDASLTVSVSNTVNSNDISVE